SVPSKNWRCRSARPYHARCSIRPCSNKRLRPCRPRSRCALAAGSRPRPPTQNRGSSRPAPGKPNGSNPTTTARVAGGLFSPQSKRLGIDLGHYSPAVLQRVIYAGTHHPSFAQGSQALRHLAGLEVPTKQVERLTQAIGQQRCAERDAATADYLDLPLPQRKSVPPGVAA